MQHVEPGNHSLRSDRVRRAPRWLGAFGAVALVLSACAGQAAEQSNTSAPGPSPAPAPVVAVEPVVTVVATTSILGDLVTSLVGADGTVTVLMGPGVDPHAYSTSAADGAAMRSADLVVANGLLLEEGLVATIDAAIADGVRVLTIADKVDPIPFGADHDDDHDDHDDNDKHDDHDDHGDEDDHDDHGDEDDHDDHGDEDPHFWWDPIRTSTAVRLIAAELTVVAPSIDWSSRADAYVAELEALDAELVALFDAIPEARRSIITNHDALGYLEARYGLEVIGTVIPGSNADAAANPRDFARLVDLVVAEGIDVIFAENTDETRLAEQLASEAVGRGDVTVRVVRLYTDSLGGPGSGAETYLDMVRTTAELIHGALAG
jgi:ABC-type Zn uptake system ZnuABC Zn-binding protein ZnuA